VRGHGGRYPLLTDEDLISLVGAGDAFAFSALHDRHSRVTYSLARRLSGDDKDAEDLAQEAFLQRVAMRMGCMASWTDESLFQRPPSEDRGCHRTRNAQGPGRSHFRSRNLHRQALRLQGPKRRISGAGQGSGQTTQDRRASWEAPRSRPPGAPVCHPKGAMRVRGGCGRGFGEPLDDVPFHSSDRFHPQKGGRTPTERDEFLRAAWRVMVAAQVDPGWLVFVDEMGLHTSLAPLYGYSPKGERVRLEVPRNLKARTPPFWPP
jgi:hypothetical protein